MKKRSVGIFLVILLMGLVLPGCSRGRINELGAQVSQLTNQVAEQEAQIGGQKTKLAEQESQIAVLSANITELNSQNNTQGVRIEELEGELSGKDAQITALEEEVADLEAENEHLKAPTPEISAEVVGTITFKGLIQLAGTYFTNPKVGRTTSAWTKGPYSLVSLETLKAFLGKDDTNKYPPPRLANRNICDEYAFRLKDHWIRAGLPGHSLSLIKRERMTGRGMTLYWSCIFITKEEGQSVIYEVVPYTDEIIKLEKPDTEVYYVLIADRL